MAYDSRKVFLEVDRRLSANPVTHLYEIARQLGCSHPTIEHAVRKHTFLTFREYQKGRLLEMGIVYLRNGHKVREIGSLLGYRWSEDFLRLVKRRTGRSLRDLSQNDGSVRRGKAGDDRLPSGELLDAKT